MKWWYPAIHHWLGLKWPFPSVWTAISRLAGINRFFDKNWAVCFPNGYWNENDHCFSSREKSILLVIFLRCFYMDRCSFWRAISWCIQIFGGHWANHMPLGRMQRNQKNFRKTSRKIDFSCPSEKFGAVFSVYQDGLRKMTEVSFDRENVALFPDVRSLSIRLSHRTHW